MLDVKQAAQVARDYFHGLYSDAEAFSHVLVEEVERTEKDGAPYWRITLGFTDESGAAGAVRHPLSEFAQQSLPFPRRYQRFTIHGETGEVEAMTIRALEYA